MKAEYIAAGKWVALKGVHGNLQELVRRYCFVGGMPEAVRTYAETRDLGQVRRVQNRILRDYDKDFAKHAKPRLLAKIRLLWNAIPAQLAKENKKFIYTALRQGARAREYETALIWLRDAGMVHVVSNVTTPMMPLRICHWWFHCGIVVHLKVPSGGQMGVLPGERSFGRIVDKKRLIEE